MGQRGQHASGVGAGQGAHRMARVQGGRESTYHVHTTPDLVRAKENWAPHSIWHTPCPFSLSMFWGTLQPSLPPRPNFPKSPSPQENTKPRFKEDTLQHRVCPCPPPGRNGEAGRGAPSSVRARVCASLLPQATWITRCPSSTFTCSTANVRVESGGALSPSESPSRTSLHGLSQTPSVGSLEIRQW